VAELREKVDRLERALMELVYVQHKTELEIQRLSQELREFKDEMQDFKDGMRAFKDEMGAFKNEMLVFKDEMKDFKDEMLAFKNEMKDFKDEMRAFKDEMREEVKRINKQWGELANRLGTLVEDIVLPAVRPVIRKYFKCEPELLMANVKRKKGEKREEFDVIAVCENETFLIEVKSKLKPEHAELIKRKAESFKELFPEYSKGKLNLILASLNVDEGVVRALTKEGIYVMAYREWEYFDILNFEEVRALEK
jgi:hypothetical protein